ncbi:MAG: NAD(+)/NADH kinase [Verrucomicrobiales bacterium]
MSAARQFGLIANPTKPETASLARAVLARMEALGWSALPNEETACLLGNAMQPISADEIAHRAAFIVVLGGDGTILRTARAFGPGVPPLAAINVGRLGFLTTAAENQIDEFLLALTSGRFTLSHRSLLEVSYATRSGQSVIATALNEATLTRGRQPRMILIEARIDGDLLNRYRGDGLIVSTPTGSTAYSLSAGGPLVSPKANVFVVTPICSHTLSDLAVVVGDSASLELIPLGEADETLLTLDGDGSVAVPIGIPIRLRRAAYDLPLVDLPGHNFFRLVQSKLGWSGSTV